MKLRWALRFAVPSLRPQRGLSGAESDSSSLKSTPHFVEAMSALSKVCKALGGGESVWLQGEEVLLRQEEAGALTAVRGGQWVLDACAQGRRRGCVGGRRQSLWVWSGSGGWGGDGGRHQAAVLLRALAPKGKPPHGAAPPCWAGAGGGRAGLPGGGSEALRRGGEDHGDGLALAAAQGEADGLRGGLFGPQAGAAVNGHQRAHHHKGHEDAAHHQEGHIDGFWGGRNSQVSFHPNTSAVSGEDVPSTPAVFMSCDAAAGFSLLTAGSVHPFPITLNSYSLYCKTHKTVA